MARTAKPTIQPPDLMYVIALKAEMERLYTEQDAQIDRLRLVREMQQQIDVGRAKVCNVEIRDATIADELQRVAAMFTVNPTKCSVTPSKQTDAAQSNATLREHFSEAVLDQAGRRELGPTTWERCVDAACADGGAWCKWLFSKDLWDRRYALSLPKYRKEYGDAEGASRFHADTEEAKKEAGVPFEWVHVDARSVYPVIRGRRLLEVLEIQNRPFSPTFRQYRLGFNATLDEIVPEEVADPDWRRRYQSMGGVATVQFLEHWTDTYCTYAVYGGPHGSYHLVQQWAHGYGRVPYFAALPLVHNEWKNRKVGWSIAEPKRYLVEALSYYRTLHAQVASFQAMPPMFRVVPADGQATMGRDGAPLVSQTYDPGYVYNLNPGEKVEIPNFPPVAESLREEITNIRADIEKMEPPRLQADGNMQGAGFAIAQVIAENKTRWSPIANSLSRMLEDVTRFMWQLVREKVGEPVWVHKKGGEDAGFISAGPEDLTDAVRVEWDVSPETASAKVIEERYWAARVSNGSASIDMMIEALGDNPDEVRQGRALDRIRATPWYQSAEDAGVLAQIGRGDLLRLQQQAEQMAQTGAVPPAPGVQGAPTAPGEPGMLPGANGPQPAQVLPQGAIPDFGNLALSPGGGGAAPVTPAGIPSAGGYGPNVGQTMANAQKVMP